MVFTLILVSKKLLHKYSGGGLKNFNKKLFHLYILQILRKYSQWFNYQGAKRAKRKKDKQLLVIFAYTVS